MALEEFGVILAALRKKLMRIGIVIGIGTFGSFPFMSRLLNQIQKDLLPEGVKTVIIQPVEAIVLELKMSLIIGVLLSLPLIAYYVYDALKNRYDIASRFELKKSFIVLVAVSALILFFLGATYSYFIMLPFLLRYLNILAMSVGATSTWSLELWVHFAIMMTVVFGLAFELPIVLPLLARFGVVNYQTLREYRKHGIVIVFIVAAIITPPDVISQMMIAAPMLLFYEVGLLITRIAIKS
ncbi:MAG: twin-arginine translocase subunit TatC [Methanocellales archaeon]|nr:twin-arginine translocase subunit TatC [Methanocellales archaeon]MDD3291815.1 twin-arginine translocase subunit TatC [Methanocellales archaeon]MDD5234571.1 twin-arginine translocase subunit TatC [Methanocellales archaeon]MDD5485076.1 twin-arginine translocase subunit TatC [Methanocellales archaeon]